MTQQNRTMRLMGQIVMLFAFLILLTTSAHTQIPGEKPPGKSMAKVEGKIAAKVILYLFQREDASHRHKPWLYSVNAKSNIDKRILAAKLSGTDAHFVDESWLSLKNEQKRPEHFMFLSIGPVDWITQTRVKVGAYIADDLYWESSMKKAILSEAVATVFVRRVGNSWRIEKNKTVIQYGE